MKAITVWQPWAQLLAEGKKHDETRSWRTNYRGEILIHAAKKDPIFGISQMPDDGWEKALLSFGLYEAFNRFERFPTGAIIGAAILTDAADRSDIPRLHKGALSGGISLRRLHGRSVCLEV